MLDKPPSCSGCPIFGTGRGFVPADGSGRNGVLIVLEAAGADEEIAGLPTVGKSGYYLFTNLAKIGLQRDDFRIHNVLSCRPPDNRLAGEAYEDVAILHCSPNLDHTVQLHIQETRARGMHPVILALGRIAFRRVMGLPKQDPIITVKGGYHGYVHHSSLYDCHVLSADHPSYLMRGQHHLVPTLQYAAQRAVEVARDGFTYDEPLLLLDPPQSQAAMWVREFKQALDVDGHIYLSTDIETPMKARKSEEELVREDDEDYIILRCSFSYQHAGVFYTMSVLWTAEYLPLIEDMLADVRVTLLFWNESYDLPRIRNQMAVAAANVDGMLAWHILNSALEKKLGFVTPYYWKTARVWKHLSDSQPARYNAIDALAALINFIGIARDLERAGQWHTFERHVVKLNIVLNGMSAAGLLRDEVQRQAAEIDLTRRLDDVEKQIEMAVPQEARREVVYKKKPRSQEGVCERTVSGTRMVCNVCGVERPAKSHFKRFVKKVNLCADGSRVPIVADITQYYRVKEWKPSTVQLVAYQKSLKQQAYKNRDGAVTFDEDAIGKLVKKYPNDRLYPLLLDHRKFQKLRGTYIGITDPETGMLRGGLRIGRDGRIHAEFSHNPSTLRLACQNPNMQNLPRMQKVLAGEEEPLENIVRNLVVAADGHTLLEADYAAIEAVLSAYFARWRDGIRLAKLGVHSYLASHVLGRPADLAWSDADLKIYFGEIKGSKDPKVNLIYNGCKRAIHLSNYGGTPRKMVQAEPETFPTVAYAERLQGMYFEVAKPIRSWQLQTQMDAHDRGFLRNPYGYIHRFTHVFKFVKEGGKWVRKPGDQANDVLAFLPQSTAAGIIKEAMLRLWDTPAGPMMRLQVHDSLVLEVLDSHVDDMRQLLTTVMEQPIVELPLPASYGMGPALQIDVETKVGKRWGQVR